MQGCRMRIKYCKRYIEQFEMMYQRGGRYVWLKRRKEKEKLLESFESELELLTKNK